MKEDNTIGVEFNEIDNVPLNMERQHILTEDGLISLAALREQLIADFFARPFRLKIKDTYEYGYIVLERDTDGNLSPIYLSEEEYNA